MDTDAKTRIVRKMPELGNRKLVVARSREVHGP
jgi:hypothetical protein